MKLAENMEANRRITGLAIFLIGGASFTPEPIATYMRGMGAFAGGLMMFGGFVR